MMSSDIRIKNSTLNCEHWKTLQAIDLLQERKSAKTYLKKLPVK